eukprot:12903305-Prorocentrum_lima.AAC.1
MDSVLWKIVWFGFGYTDKHTTSTTSVHPIHVPSAAQHYIMTTSTLQIVQSIISSSGDVEHIRNTFADSPNMGGPGLPEVEATGTAP